MVRTRQPSLPLDVREALSRLACRRSDGAVRVEDIAAATSLLNSLPAHTITRADQEIATAAELYHQPNLVRSPLWRWFRPPSDQELLEACPAYRDIFIFHYDGHLREAALNHIDGGISSPFYVAAIACRLNDWAAQVREAARRCAERTFPKTPAPVIATAAVFLLDRRQHWQRWGNNADLLEDALARQDVCQHLANVLLHAKAGAMTAVLRQALRFPNLDQHLCTLASAAFLPSVRAAALHCLLEGRARWPSGRERQWIDKSMGLFRVVTSYTDRPLTHPESFHNMVRMGALDRAAAVRKVTVSALVRRWESLPELMPEVERLARDRNSNVREQAEFILRKHAQATGGP